MTDPRDLRCVKTPNYNMAFNMRTGQMLRWGRTREEDPEWCHIGPEIADIEISKNGCPTGCKFCYKANTNAPPENMSLRDFMTLLDKFPPTLCQVALGITGARTNPDFINIMKYCRMKKVLPNYTMTGVDLTDEIADATADFCGAVAVSCYPGALDLCFDTVKRLTDRGMAQVNIHVMLSEETAVHALRAIEAAKTDSRLSRLNAIVFLSLKPKGRASSGDFHRVSDGTFYGIVYKCFQDDIDFGFDSCTGHRLISLLDRFDMSPQRKAEIIEGVEPCESSLFSTYINANGECWHCSFSEGEPGVECVDTKVAKDFGEVWRHPNTQAFRERLLKNGRRCPVWSL